MKNSTKTLFLVFFLEVAAFAADTELQMTNTVSTNAETGHIYSTVVFTRDGMTNLVQSSRSVNGKLAGIVQRFYHKDQFVAVHVRVYGPQPAPRESFTTLPSPYQVSVDFSDARELRRLSIDEPNGPPVDVFTATNGVFHPIESLDFGAPQSE